MSSLAFGGFYHHDDLGLQAANTGRTDWGISLAYTLGALRFGVEYARARVGAGVAGGGDEGRAVAFGVNFAVGGGVGLQTEMQFWTVEDNLGSRANENDATVFLVGTTVYF